MPIPKKKPTVSNGKKKIFVKKVIKVVKAESVSSEESDFSDVFENEEVLVNEVEEKDLDEENETEEVETEEVKTEEVETEEVKTEEVKTEQIKKNLLVNFSKSSWKGFLKSLYDDLRSDGTTGKPALFEIINLLFMVILEDKLENFNACVKHPKLKFNDGDKFKNIFEDFHNRINDKKLITGIEKNKIYADLWSNLYNQKKHMKNDTELNDQELSVFTKMAKNPVLKKMIIIQDNISSDIKSSLPIDKITKFHTLDKIEEYENFNGTINVSSKYANDAQNEDTSYVKYGKLLYEMMKKIYDKFYVDGESILSHMKDSEFDVFGEAFESMMADTNDTKSKKQGEYFTRRDVCRLIVEELKPELNEVIGDMAAGTGGFIHVIIEMMIHKGITEEERINYFEKNIHANEMDAETFKLLCGNMLFHDKNGHILKNLVRCNSLDLNATRIERLENPNKNADLIGTFNVLVGNPPYGKGKKRPNYQFNTLTNKLISSIDLKGNPDLKKNVELFWGPLDRGNTVITTSLSCQFMMLNYQYLKIGGRAGIVTDRGLLSNGNNKGNSWEKEFRKFFLEKTNIWKIILLPDGIFGQTTFSTCIIFFKKGESTKEIQFIEGYFKQEDKGKGEKPMYLRDSLKLKFEDIAKKNWSLDLKDYVAKKEGIECDTFNILVEWKKLGELIQEYKKGYYSTNDLKSNNSLNPNSNKIQKEKFKNFTPNKFIEIDFYNSGKSNPIGKMNIPEEFEGIFTFPPKNYQKNDYILLTMGGGNKNNPNDTTSGIYFPYLINNKKITSTQNTMFISFINSNKLMYYLLKINKIKLLKTVKYSGNLGFGSIEELKNIQIHIPSNQQDQNKIVQFLDFLFGEGEKPDFISDIPKRKYDLDIVAKFCDGNELMKHLFNEEYISFIEKIKLAHRIEDLKEIPEEPIFNELSKRNGDDFYLNAFLQKEWDFITKDIEMEEVKLGDICEIQIGKTPKKENNNYVDKGELWANIADIGSKTLEKTKFNISNECAETFKNYAEENEIIFSFKLSIGKVSIATQRTYFNEAIGVIKKGKLSNLYFYYSLKMFLKNGKCVGGIGNGSLSKDRLKDVLIQIPKNPQDEQKIVQYLEEKMEFHKKYWEHLKEIM
jgi:type I restriction-modification system DNA methylase subunit